MKFTNYEPSRFATDVWIVFMYVLVFAFGVIVGYGLCK